MRPFRWKVFHIEWDDFKRESPKMRRCKWKYKTNENNTSTVGRNDAFGDVTGMYVLSL